MDKDSSEDSQARERVIQERIKRIRERSAIPTSEWRRRKYLTDVEWRKGILEKSPAHMADRWPVPRPPEEFTEEDTKRDGNMITSADILDLTLSELGDHKKGLVGFHSQRTDKLTRKIAGGLIWGIEADEANLTNGGIRRVRDKLLETHDPAQIIVALHEFLTLIHKAPIPNIPVRDLYWLGNSETQDFLDFLSNDLE